MNIAANEQRKYVNDLSMWFTDHEVDAKITSPTKIVITPEAFEILADLPREDRQELFALLSGVEVEVKGDRGKIVSARDFVKVLDGKSIDPIGNVFCTYNQANEEILDPFVLLPDVECVYGSAEWLEHMSAIRNSHRDPLTYIMSGRNRDARRKRSLGYVAQGLYTRGFLDGMAGVFVNQPKPVGLSQRDLLLWLWANRKTLSLDEQAEIFMELPQALRLVCIRQAHDEQMHFFEVQKRANALASS